MSFKIKKLFILFSVFSLLNAVLLWQEQSVAQEIQSPRLTLLQSSHDVAIQRSHHNELKQLTKLFYVPVLHLSTSMQLQFHNEQKVQPPFDQCLLLADQSSSSNQPRAPPVSSLNS